MKLIKLKFLSKKIVMPLHRSTVSGRRVKILSHHLSQLIPPNQSLIGLDVGCGSGELAKNIQEIQPCLKLSGVDVLVRKDAIIDVTRFDGERLPFEDKSCDFTLLVDVLHHTNHPESLLQECIRVSRKFILLKDHVCESWWDRVRLMFMDWVGNRAYDVYLPYNYLSMKDWNSLYQISKVKCERENFNLKLYPKPFSWLFDSTLHFIAILVISDKIEL